MRLTSSKSTFRKTANFRLFCNIPSGFLQKVRSINFSDLGSDYSSGEISHSHQWPLVYQNRAVSQFHDHQAHRSFRISLLSEISQGNLRRTWLFRIFEFIEWARILSSNDCQIRECQGKFEITNRENLEKQLSFMNSKLRWLTLTFYRFTGTQMIVHLSSAFHLVLKLQ